MSNRTASVPLSWRARCGDAPIDPEARGLIGPVRLFWPDAAESGVFRVEPEFSLHIREEPSQSFDYMFCADGGG